MHCVVSWDIKSEGEAWKLLNDQLLEQLKGYSWVRPLNTFYIVQISSQENWTALLNKFQTVAKPGLDKIHLVMSPAMQGGRYDGMLPNSTWEEINKRTT